MLSRTDAEDLILHMADIVNENRYLRERIEELEKINEENSARIREHYDYTQKMTANLLHNALTAPLERAAAVKNFTDNYDIVPRNTN